MLTKYGKMELPHKFLVFQRPVSKVQVHLWLIRTETLRWKFIRFISSEALHIF